MVSKNFGPMVKLATLNVKNNNNNTTRLEGSINESTKCVVFTEDKKCTSKYRVYLTDSAGAGTVRPPLVLLSRLWEFKVAGSQTVYTGTVGMGKLVLGELPGKGKNGAVYRLYLAANPKSAPKESAADAATPTEVSVTDPAPEDPDNDDDLPWS